MAVRGVVRAAVVVEEIVVSSMPHGYHLERLARCLAGLAERERTIVALSFYAERDADAIATELGLNPGNVRVVRHRALARLRSCMERP